MSGLKDYLTVSQVAKELRQSRQEIVRKIWRSFIKAEKIGKIYFIHKAELARFKKKFKKGSAL